MIESESAHVTADTETRQYGFVHSALIYRSQQELLDLAGRFIGDGLASGEAMLLALPPETLALLHDQLYDGDELPLEVRIADITEAARNPSRFMEIGRAHV